MGKDRLDKFIKNQVEEHKTLTDPDLLWQKIQAKQDAEKKPKRRLLIFCLLGGVFLLLSLALLYTFQFSDTDNKQYQDDFITNENPKDNNLSAEKAAETKSDEENSNDPKQTSEATVNASISSSIAIDDKKSGTAAAKNTTTKSLDFNSTITTKNIDSSTNSLAQPQQSIIKNDFESTKKIANSSSVSDENKTISTRANDLTKQVGETDAEDNIPTPVNANDLSVKKETTEIKEEKTENSVSSNTRTPPTLEKKESSQTPTTNPALDKQERDSTSVGQQKEETDTFEKEDKKKVKEKQWRFSPGAAFTYGKALRTLSSGGSAPSDYLQAREDTETSLDAVRMNLDFMLQHKSGFYLKSGLEYEQINESFDAYTERDSTGIVPDQLIAIAYGIDGTISEIKGNAAVTTTHWSRKKIYNHYRSIDIPLIVGYQSTKEDKRLGWFVEGGASMNIWFDASGEIFDNNGQSLTLENNSDLFKTRTGISLIGAAGLTYKVANRFSIWASPDIKYHLRSVTSDKNSLSQKYLNTGFRIGFRYHFPF